MLAARDRARLPRGGAGIPDQRLAVGGGRIGHRAVLDSAYRGGSQRAAQIAAGTRKLAAGDRSGYLPEVVVAGLREHRATSPKHSIDHATA